MVEEMIIVRFGLTIHEAKYKMEKALKEYLQDGWQTMQPYTVKYDKEMRGYTVRQRIVLD